MNSKFLKCIIASFTLLLMSGYSSASFKQSDNSLVSSTSIKEELSKQSLSKRPVREKWALIIGISKYQEKGLNLRYPAKDAKDFCNFLLTDGHFRRENVRMLLDEQATRRNILTLLADNWLPQVAKKDDLVVVYISSHGSASDLDAAGVNYLLSHDSELNSLYATAIPFPLLSEIKARIPSDRVVFVVDACNSGAAITAKQDVMQVGSKGSKEPDAVLLMSSSPSQSSWESKRYENSVFTRRFIDTLKSQGAEARIGETFEQLKETVSEEVFKDRGVKQIPSLKNRSGIDAPILAVTGKGS